MRLFFASDFHGSDVCFKKFLRARKFYAADVLMLGGDLCAKSVAWVKESEHGWEVKLGNRLIQLKDSKSLEKCKVTLANQGYLVRAGDTFENDSAMRASIEIGLQSQLERWYELAKRESPADPIYFVPGNDDPLYLDKIFEFPFINLHAKQTDLTDQIAVLGLGGSTPTPWNTEREYSETQFEGFIAHAHDARLNNRKLIFLLHCPPYGSGLDLAPALQKDFSYELHLGMPRPIPVGSMAIRTAITELKPILALSGHVHESRGYTRLGSTLCINPGSTFWTGRLQGCIVDLSDSSVSDFRLTEG
jgi:Icc-related predicted phosphoesterase